MLYCIVLRCVVQPRHHLAPISGKPSCSPFKDLICGDYSIQERVSLSSSSCEYQSKWISKSSCTYCYALKPVGFSNLCSLHDNTVSQMTGRTILWHPWPSDHAQQAVADLGGGEAEVTATPPSPNLSSCIFSPHYFYPRNLYVGLPQPIWMTPMKILDPPLAGSWRCTCYRLGIPCG